MQWLAKGHSTLNGIEMSVCFQCQALKFMLFVIKKDEKLNLTFAKKKKS